MDEVTVPAEGAEGQAGGDNQQSDNASDSALLDDVILDFGEQKTTRETYSSEQGEESDKSEEESQDKKEQPEPKKGQEQKSTDEEDDGQDTPVIRQMRQTIKSLKKQVKRLESDREEPGKKKSDEPESLSDDQLKALMKEHADDPDVLFNIVKYMQERGVKDATKASQELAKRDKVAHGADKYFSGIFSTYGQDEFNEQLDTDFPQDQWALHGHPFARQIQTALAVANMLPAIVKRETQKAIQAKEKETRTKVEDKRKEAVQQRGGLPKPAADTRTSAVPALDERRMSVVKELGLNSSQQKLYANLLAKKG